jgi:murein DD-endopeptidase MepM/ murein hydrolase activator NlpD
MAFPDVLDGLNRGRTVELGVTPPSGTHATDAARGFDAEKIKALAAQFESMLVSQMLKEMRASMFESKDDGGAGLGPLSDSLFSELSLAISRAGGVGLADSLIAPLSKQTFQTDQTVQTDKAKQIRVTDQTAPSDVTAQSDTNLPINPSLAGRVSSAYGWRRDPIDDSKKFHKGLDIALPVGHPIPAPQSGNVMFAGEQSGYGLTVVIDHGNSLTTKYAHLSSIDVRVGDSIGAGQVIGKAGATGRATGPHLHFEVIESGKTVNPEEKLATYTASRPQ